LDFPGRVVRHLTRPLLLVIVLAGSGCVTIGYQRDPLALYMSQPAKQALAEFEKLDYPDRNQTLYHLDKAVLLRMNGDYRAISLREQAAAVTVNDIMRSYLPAPFERAMLYCLKILNYLQLGDIEGARVEALQLDVFLKQKFDKQEPPFARYLNGLVFETNGELSDALIAYRKAYKAYHAAQLSVPRQLQADLLRLTEQQGLKDEHKKYSDEFNLAHWPHQVDLDSQGEVIAVVFSGLVPRKFETAINTQSPESGQLHRIAVPVYEERVSQVGYFELQSGDKRQGSEQFERIDEEAYANLADQMPGIITRAVARVAVKDKISDNMADKNQLLGAITNIAGFISEQADTRAWNTLPQQILLSRMALPPGDYNIDIRLKSGGATVATRALEPLKLQARQKRFFSWHWPASSVSNRRHYDANINYSATIYYRPH
jgi:hypothetical protein